MNVIKQSLQKPAYVSVLLFIFILLSGCAAQELTQMGSAELHQNGQPQVAQNEESENEQSALAKDEVNATKQTDVVQVSNDESLKVSDGASEPRPRTEVEPPRSTAVKEADSELTVSISIIGDEETGMVLSWTEVLIEEGDTVLDVLNKAAAEHAIQMEHRGRKSLAYVEGIANLYEFDKGPGSGWVFALNGTLIGQSSGAAQVQKGDEIEWFYSLDFGKDYGERSP